MVALKFSVMDCDDTTLNDIESLPLVWTTLEGNLWLRNVAILFPVSFWFVMVYVTPMLHPLIQR